MDFSTALIFTAIIIAMLMFGVILYWSREEQIHCMRCGRDFKPSKSTAGENYRWSFDTEECRKDYNQNRRPYENIGNYKS